MSNEEIIDIVTKAREIVKDSSANFGIFQYGGGSDESYISANRSGLLLFAFDLLDAATKLTDDPKQGGDEPDLRLSYHAAWIDSDSTPFVQYIVQALARVADAQLHGKTSLFDRIFPIGCISLVVFLLIAMFIGVYQIVSWLF
ncbi:MAG: hypothetical protein EOO88_01305 [Pedobacter sp.]|nr:MAG: hypothetical protein EOO88_01305 [Pedobacter sp.]